MANSVIYTAPDGQNPNCFATAPQESIEVQLLIAASAAMRTLLGHTVTDPGQFIGRSLSKNEIYSVLRCMMQSVSAGQYE